MLTKLSKFTQVPGSPELIYIPAHTVCSPGPPGPPENPGDPGSGGTWVNECVESCIPIGVWTMQDYQFGSCALYQVGTTKYLCGIIVCHTVWHP